MINIRLFNVFPVLNNNCFLFYFIFMFSVDKQPTDFGRAFDLMTLY